MTRKAVVRAAGIGALTFAFGAFLPAGIGPPSPSPAVPDIEWTVDMTITVKGSYELEGRAKASGRYNLKMTWTGGLEWDGDDYILIKGEDKPAEWTAEESATGPGGILILTTDDFQAAPELNVSYVLRRSNGIHLSFIIRGFEVPRSFSRNTFYLHFPASAENEENPGGVKYNLFVKSGSNAVVLDDPAGIQGPGEKTFRWTWVRRSAVRTERETGFFESNRHEAEVTVVIRPVR
ncbi:MAG: hypothetical protein JW843_01335 [Candidatus Aminicenantes bacterium]|nr:hypothetical protein [Candidatus Aminicenantes bacterium]